MATAEPRVQPPVKTPTVLQMEAAECGAAALAIVLEYHGRYVPLDVLRDDCGVSRDGSNALYVREAAKKYGLEVKAFRKPAEGLRNRVPPFIVFWQRNHFLVIEGFSPGRVHINDPSVGRRTISDEEFRRGYSEMAMTFVKGPDFQTRGRRPSALRGLIRRLSSSKRALGFVILAGLALVVPNLVTAAFQRVFIDEILVAGHRGWLRPLLFAMLLTAGVRFAAVALQKVHLTRMEIKLALSESLPFLWHVLRLPVSFFQHRYTGDIVSRTESAGRVANLISGELATTAVSLLTLVFYIGVMLPYDPFLTIVGVAISGLNLVALRWFNRVRIDHGRAIQQIRGRLVASVMWAIQIIESVKATGSESSLLVRLAADQARMINADQSVGIYNALLIVIPPFLSSVTSVLILGLGGGQVVLGSLSIGTLVAFQALLVGFNQPFHDLARLGGDLQDLRGDLDRIDDVRHRAVDPAFAAKPRVEVTVSRPRRLSGHLEFRKVTFGYNRTVDEPLLKEFSLVARPGARIALVGSSGSGKSTIGRLAAGLYQPWSGEILYDGRPIAEIPHEILVNSTAMVDAEICLFEGTIRDNLTLWDDMVPADRLVQACVDAAIHRDILKRRGGYDAPVAEQARNFSGGQRQRLQIARALSRDPNLLILDEATSALDPKTERMVDDNLRRRGMTCLIIAHRLTTIRDCDEIIVLAGGRVAQRGTHEDLITDPGGEYARLISHQAVASRTPGRLSLTRRQWSAAAMPPGEPDAAASNGTAHANGSDSASPSSAGPASAPETNDRPMPRFLVEELFPHSRPERTAANMPLALDDQEAVWWVSSGSVDVFFTARETGREAGRRRHLCRVDEGGTIFSISGVRGRGGGALFAIGAGPAQLFKFCRGDLIRLSFEEGLSSQVAMLVDDWVIRVCDAVSRLVSIESCAPLEPDAQAQFARGARYRSRHGVGWVRHHSGSSLLLDQTPLPQSEVANRFPLTDQIWLTANEPCCVSVCDTVTMIEQGDPWAGLDQFHRSILDFVATVQERNAQQRLEEFERALERDRSLFDAVAIGLAAAANDSVESGGNSGDDPLLRACRAVARSLGLEIRTPRGAGAQSSGVASDRLGDIARASGFHVRSVELPGDWWRWRGGEPLLGHMAGPSREPVALLPLASRWYWPRAAYVLEDQYGRRRPVDRTLAAQISAAAWVFYRVLPDAPVSVAGLVRFCSGVSGLSREILTVVGLAVIGGLFGLAIPVSSGILVDQVIPAADTDRLRVICVFLLLLTVASTVFRVVQWLTVLRIEGRVSAALIPAVWDRLLRLPTRFFEQYSSGDLALRAMGLTDIFKKLSGTVVSTAVTGFFSCFNLALLFYYSWKLAVVTAVLLGVLFSVTAVLLAGALRRETAIRRLDGNISGLLLELLGGMITLRTGGAETRAFARWARLYTDRLTLSINVRWISNTIHEWLAVFPIIAAMVIYYGAVHLDEKLLDVGSFLAFTIAFANLMSAVLDVGYTTIGLLELWPMFERIRPILEGHPEFPAAIAEAARLTGALAFNHVTFRYPGQDKGARVLDDVSLQVLPGEFVAIVGPSGSGKSTLMRLLLGFETPDSGTVTYDGRDLGTLDLRDLRRQIGVVLQNAQLMPSDIYSNIVGFASTLTPEHAWEAARMAGLDDDIRKMPMGMHTLIGEAGGNLSSGQRQRLLIARAIVCRPKILLLDEATSALDNVTQSIVSDSLTTHLHGVTRVVIAHRLDAIIKADRIYVLKEGKIVQSGRYHQLLEEQGPFRELARRQMV
jgi:NHLM bacteriocin system ABC transporter peptidase/ATP-binding protein/NHLM bacteriocin system ABC transporter ATP-binding protein